ncbi:MAG: hypothetical protein AABX82_03230 [Nanoarchaeota archaeon]
MAEFGIKHISIYDKRKQEDVGSTLLPVYRTTDYNQDMLRDAKALVLGMNPTIIFSFFSSLFLEHAQQHFKIARQRKQYL